MNGFADHKGVQSTNQSTVNQSTASQSTNHSDIYIFSDEHLKQQLDTAPIQLGYKIVKFYVDERDVISKTPTAKIDIFYLSPSGGTLRDKNMNIVTYSARYDMYKGIGRV